MKRIFTLLGFVALSSTSFGQRLLVEDFNYAAGQLTDEAGGANVSGGNWLTITATGLTHYATVVAGSLAYPGYHTSPTATSNKVLLQSVPSGQSLSIEDVFRNFTAVTSGTVYTSFLVKFNSIENLGNATSAGDYFMAFAPSLNAFDYRARVFVRKGVAANTIQFGLAASSVSASVPIVWSPIDRSATDVHLITFSYQFVAGAGNDITRLFIDQPISETEPLVPDALSILATAEPVDISRITIREGTAFAPNADLDAIVVATTYAASLPLNLTSFNAVSSGKATLVKWTTDNEVNVSGFSIEKSLDGTNFSQVEFVDAKNNSSHNVYTLNDTKVKAGISYYRLKLVDKNGAFKYSGIVAVKNNAITKADVFPNPAKGNLTVSHSEAEKGAIVRIMTLDGKQVKAVNVLPGSTQTGLTINELVKGNYIVLFENNGSKSVTQFTKQ